MNRVNGYVIIYLVSVISFCAAGPLNISTVDGDGRENGTEADGDGSVPVVLTKINQIIAREGNCALIDCNITGDPFPNVQWFNSHGHLLDTKTSGTFTVKTLSLSYITRPTHGHFIHFNDELDLLFTLYACNRIFYSLKVIFYTNIF